MKTDTSTNGQPASTAVMRDNDAETTEPQFVDAEILDLNEAQARQLTEEIRIDRESLWTKIARAYSGRAWKALGYESWDAYCDGEFEGGLLRLPREERREVVCSLREAGMSGRAISAATGLSKGTVHRELSGAQNGAPDAATTKVTGRDDKKYPKHRKSLTERIAAHVPPADGDVQAPTAPSSTTLSDPSRNGGDAVSDAERSSGQQAPDAPDGSQAGAAGPDPVRQHRMDYTRQVLGIFRGIADNGPGWAASVQLDDAPEVDIGPVLDAAITAMHQMRETLIRRGVWARQAGWPTWTR
jgi:hypothetical protein